jgi:ribosome-associated toxin RatA of RatAB toxin-antitoxin module
MPRRIAILSVMDIHRVLLVQHPAERMYDLIEGAEHYPDFLPWCAKATVLERSELVVAATIGIDWHGVRLEFTTRNRKRRPEWLELALERGPFRRFRGEWLLKPLGVEGCKIDFTFHYEFASEVLGRVASPVFERITNTLVDAFVHRADQLGDGIPKLARVDPHPPRKGYSPGDG